MTPSVTAPRFVAAARALTWPRRVSSMRSRMTRHFAFFAALLMGVGSVLVWKSEVLRLEGGVHEALMVARERAHYEMEDKDRKDNPRTVLSVMQESQGEISAGGLSLMVVDDRGHVLWRAQRDTPEWPNIGDNWRISTFSQDGQTLVMGRDWTPYDEELGQLAVRLALLSLVVVCATSFAAWGLVGRTLSPLDELVAQAQSASVDSLHVRLETPSSDAEMQRLTATLNDLLASLEKEAQARGRFYAAASHELRTPIQGLLGRLDVARSRTRSVEEYQTLIAGLQTSTERLAGLVQELLELNALEMRQNQAPLEQINLAFWVERELERQSVAIAGRPLHLEAHLPELHVCARPFHIEMLLRNLLENAVKYSTPGTPLRVALCSGEGGVALEIENQSDVPEGTEVNNWFEPFFRRDASRSTATGGNGLGLSIVAALARANGWRIELHTKDGAVCARVMIGG